MNSHETNPQQNYHQVNVVPGTPSKNQELESQENVDAREIQPQHHGQNQGFQNRHPIHPSRCPPLDLNFLWKLYHSRQHLSTLTNATTQKDRIEILRSQGFPFGLASLILNHTHDFPLRIWLVDNGGTMHHNDGHIITKTSGQKVAIVDCSRWQEVSVALRWHAELAAWVQTPMAVRFLRDPGVHVGPQQIGVSASKNLSASEELTRLNAVLQKIRPTGATTPIQYHLEDLMPTLHALAPKLEEQQRRIVISICTDSIPTDVDGLESPEIIDAFMSTLKTIMEWPVHIVLRLLTDEERVVQFYDHMSRQNSNLQVLDDYLTECKQVQKYNPWFHYGYPLHLCREQGIQIPILEALSKRALSGTEPLAAVMIIFNQIQPHDHISYVHFRKQVEAWNKEAGVSWSPVKKRVVPWIDMKKLDQVCGDDKCCNLM
jgi:hypothetical protein